MFKFRAISTFVQEEFIQFVVLTRHFFNRLFQNDFVDFEDQMRERILGALGILAAFSGLLSFGFLSKYHWIPDTGTSWIEKCGFLTFCMLVMGFIAVLEWDVIIPDARDYANLAPLPVRARTLLAAKFASLCLFMGLFALSMLSLSTLVFVIYLPQWQSSNPLYVLSFALVHIISIFLAVFFAFFFNVFLIGTLMTFLGYKLFNRISAYIRSLFLVMHIFLFLVYLRLILYGFVSLEPWEKLKANDSALQYFFDFFPPLWFTDLYETLLGNPNLPIHGSFNFALFGLLLMVGTFYLTTGLSYRHSIKKLGSVQRRRIHFKKLKTYFTNIFNWLFLRNPIQRAVFHFYRKTLKASMFHKMRLVYYVAVGVGLIPIQIATRGMVHKTLFGINKTMLSIPLILSFFLLLGLRGIVNVPVSLEANWVFQLTEQRNVRYYFSGLRKGIFFLSLLPLFIGLFVIYFFFWGGITAFYHCFYGIMVSLLVMEGFFLTFCKVPFACSYLPGKERIQLFWLIYVFLFLAYINLMPWIELELLRAPSNFLIFFGAALLIILGIRLYQLFFFYKGIRIKYEEEPVPVMLGLDYKIPAHKRKAT